MCFYVEGDLKELVVIISILFQKLMAFSEIFHIFAR